MAHEHNHDRLLMEFHKAPVDPGPPHHTAFKLFVCAACGDVEAFPSINLKLVNRQWLIGLRALLALQGLTLNENECLCRTAGCGHVASLHRGPGGACVEPGCECGPGGWS